MLIFPKCAVATLCFSSHILISASSTNENDLISQNSRSITMGKYDQVKKRDFTGMFVLVMKPRQE